MEKTHLVLLDHDLDYAEHLSAFVRSSEFADRLVLKLFTNPRLAFAYMEQCEKPPSLLVSEALLPQVTLPKGGRVYILSEHDQIAVDAYARETVINRYQPLQRLLASVLENAGNPAGDPSPVLKTRRTEVISFYSAVGGAGKTVAAVNLARQMAQRDSRVLYVSLESVAASAFFEPDSDQRFSQLLYYLQTNPATINDKLAQFVASDPHYRFDYLPPLGSYAEAQEMSAQDSKGLLAALVDRGTYDYVVVDLESSLHPRVIGALEHSDRIFWLVTDDISCLRKTEMMLCEWERNGLACIDQVLFISNKFLGMQTNDFGAIRIHESATLPYVPQWKTVQSAQQLVSVAFYNEQLWNVFLAVTGRRKAG